MHPRISHEFNRICRERGAAGSVLEVGAPASDNSLLLMPALAGATEKIGLSLRGPRTFKDLTILRGNANEMSFADASFDVVLCNAMLEHDPYFWRSVAEMRRVTKPGGLLVIGAPGYTSLRGEALRAKLTRWPWFRRALRRHAGLDVLSATLTYEVHNAPGDYYRFSAAAFREVFFAGMLEVEVCSVMVPPRIIGAGVKPGGPLPPA